MGMALPAGGHLTHGWSVSATGKWFRAVQYGVRKETGRVDMDEVRDLARAERPKIIFCGGTAIPRTIDFPAFAEIAREVGAVLVADIAHIAGLVAGGAHPSPVGHADVITTTTHKTLRGPRGAMIMCDRRARQGARQGRVPRPAGRPAQPHHRRRSRSRCSEAATADVPRLRRTRSSPTPRRSPTALLERGFDLVSGGTDNHLILVDLDQQGHRRASRPPRRSTGPASSSTTTRVPFDPRKPFDPSGIRIGTAGGHLPRHEHGRHGPRSPAGSTPSVEAEAAGDEAAVEKVGAEVREFARGFPTPGHARLTT